ncbi:MAG: ShlB/FhaC/HecB family hemolysin secretion/activation protein [Candidatus Omnitrophota bacterium]|nr:ShlB/FhaC/HecB family hemolysin secretion/activation protein [Candidatus Omnitrophota bacterium]
MPDYRLLRIEANNIAVKIAVCFVIFVLFICSPLAPRAAAQPPNIPNSVEPGAEARRFQDEAEREKARVEKKAVKAPDIEMEKEAKPAVEAGPAFTLKGVKVTGSTIFTQEELRGEYAPLIEKEVTFKDLEAVAEKIKDRYKKIGYLTTVVYIPEQDIAEGKIEIRIAEGRLGKVEVEGNNWFSSDLIKRYIHVKKNELFNIFTLQRDLIRLNQNSDLEVKTVLSAGDEPGATNLILKVKDKFPIHAGVNYDNQGSRLTGRDRTSVSLRTSNLAGHSDSLFMNFTETTMTVGAFASYSLPVDTFGTKLGLDFSYFDMRIGREYKIYDITGNNLSFVVKAVKEFCLSETFQLSGDAGLNIKSTKKWTDGVNTTDDQLRIPFVGMDITKMDSFFGGGQTTVSPEFSFGTAEFLNASARDHPSVGRPMTCGFFFKYEQDVSRTQRMPLFDSYLSIRSQFQAATHPLPGSEQMQLGGANSVRGYPEGDYTADTGVTLNVDWVFPLVLLPKELKLPWTETPLRNQIEPMIFIDIAGGALKKVGPGERNGKFLAGIGGGVKFHFERYVTFKAEWAGAVGDEPSHGNGASTFHVSFQCQV